jgi:hypothetical protein
MRQCRYRLCGQPFWPVKPQYYFCSWDCHQAHHREPGHDYRGTQRSRETSYDLGFRAGYDLGYLRGLDEAQHHSALSPELWRQMISLTHPDRYANTPLACAADTCVRWLLAHRPADEC